jgi:hypothetical protein
MSDIETFVLRYEVDVAEATRRLDALERTVARTRDGVGAARTSMSKFGRAAAEELRDVVPGIKQITIAVREMAAGFGAAGIAIGVMVAGIKSINYAREQYTIQRKGAQIYGLGEMQMEDFTRKMQGANLDRPGAQDAFGKVADFITRARTKPGGSEAQVLTRQLGQNINTVTTAQALAGLAGLSPDMAQSVGTKAIGLSADQARAIQNVGPQGFQQNGMSDADRKNMLEGNEANKKLNTDLAELNKQFIALELTIGNFLLPTVSKFVATMADPKLQQENDLAKKRLENAKGVGGWLSAFFINMGVRRETEDEKKQLAESQKPTPAQAAKDKEERDRLDEAGRQQEQAAIDKKNSDDREARAIALFASAVASFAQAMNPEQARQALIGEMGARALGRPVVTPPGTAASTGGASSTPANAGAATGAALPNGAVFAPGTEFIRNNPGNIKVTPWSLQHGIKGENMKIGHFDTADQGIAAQHELLQSYRARGFDTIYKIVNRWAPKGKENEHMADYVAFVAKLTGIDPNVKLSDDQVAKVQYAMARFEGTILKSVPKKPSSLASAPAPAPTTSGGTKATGAKGQGLGNVFDYQVDAAIAQKSGIQVKDLYSASKGDVATYGVNLASGLNKTIMELSAQLESRTDLGTGIMATKKQMYDWARNLTQAQVERSHLDARLPGLIGAAHEGGRYQTEGAQVPVIGEVNIHITEAQDPKGTARKAVAGLVDGSKAYLNNTSTSNRS